MDAVPNPHLRTAHMGRGSVLLDVLDNQSEKQLEVGEKMVRLLC